MTDGLPTFRHTTFSMHVRHVSSNYKPIFLGAWANFWRSAVFYSIFWLILKCKSGAAHFRRYSHLSKTSQWIWISVWFYIMETPVSNRFNLQFLKLSHVFITWCLKYWFRFAWEQEGFRTFFYLLSTTNFCLCCTTFLPYSLFWPEGYQEPCNKVRFLR